MGLFDKKYCDVCGGKIGFLGNRKLEDGNLCKHCAGKLSYWFDDRRNSTVEEIKSQLAYREANEALVEAFHITRTLGQDTLLCLDEDNQKFMVSRTNDMFTENPDVLDYSMVTGCDMDIDESKTEQMREIRNSDGSTKRVSFDPPRYDYGYDFHMRIRVNHPYFSEIKFKLNRSTIYIENLGAMNMPLHHRPQGMDVVGNILTGLNTAINQTVQKTDPRMLNPDYVECYQMGQEIKAALMEIRTQVRDDIAVANAPKIAIICPACCASTLPDVNGCCEYCGSPVKR